MAVQMLIRFLCAATLVTFSTCTICQTRFDSCVYKKPSFLTDEYAKCIIHMVYKDWRKMLCSPYGVYPIEEDAEYIVDKYCDHNCKIRPHWCSWSVWKPSASCGFESTQLKRSRERKCHPETKKRLTDNRRAEVQYANKNGPYTPCKTEMKASINPTYVWGIIAGLALAVIVIAMIVILYFHRKRRRRQQHAPVRTNPPASQQPRQSVPTASAPPEAPAEPLQPSAPPVADDPPSYTLCTRRETLPPMYEEAMKMVPDPDV